MNGLRRTRPLPPLPLRRLHGLHHLGGVGGRSRWGSAPSPPTIRWLDWVLPPRRGAAGRGGGEAQQFVRYSPPVDSGGTVGVEERRLGLQRVWQKC
ncbi:hypothetical protein PR202_gb17206 [Eleusine coracana subsp. coracana]|uniref:Uncharacterized protein n=1 Tax=Eleusine coracana subsp. coracana TaxID=191504 RepID=A0AAV5F2F6_ELECO|nr:hypothetical protein PR202_gb17206 [Eleusine coracana subsp. coracana]